MMRIMLMDMTKTKKYRTVNLPQGFGDGGVDVVTVGSGGDTWCALEQRTGLGVDSVDFPIDRIPEIVEALLELHRFHHPTNAGVHPAQGVLF